MVSLVMRAPYRATLMTLQWGSDALLLLLHRQWHWALHCLYLQAHSLTHSLTLTLPPLFGDELLLWIVSSTSHQRQPYCVVGLAVCAPCSLPLTEHFISHSGTDRMVTNWFASDAAPWFHSLTFPHFVTLFWNNPFKVRHHQLDKSSSSIIIILIFINKWTKSRKWVSEQGRSATGSEQTYLRKRGLNTNRLIRNVCV